VGANSYLNQLQDRRFNSYAKTSIKCQPTSIKPHLYSRAKIFHCFRNLLNHVKFE